MQNAMVLVKCRKRGTKDSRGDWLLRLRRFRKANLATCWLLLLPCCVASSGGLFHAPVAEALQANDINNAHYEVVSIHRSPDRSGVGFSYTQNSFTASHQGIGALIVRAYLPWPLWPKGEGVSNLPKWTSSETFDVVAKVAPEDVGRFGGPNSGELRAAMLRNLLADRFKLRVHEESATIEGFVLSVVKRGSVLTPSQHAASSLEIGIPLSHGGRMVHASDDGLVAWRFFDAPISSLLEFLQGSSHAIIADQTELKGTYDFGLQLQPYNPSGTASYSNPEERWNLRALGLKVSKVMLPSPRIVVDQVERPTEN